MDLTEAEDIKKRSQEYPEEIYKKDLNDPDSHNGVITHLEPDILESGSSGGNRTPAELFQILNNDAVKVLHSICLQIWKTQH